MPGGADWFYYGQLDQMGATASLDAHAGVPVGQHTTTRMSLEMFNGMFGFNENGYYKQTAGGLKLLKVERWGDFGTQSIRYAGSGINILPSAVNMGETFNYTTTFTASTDRGGCTGTANGTVRVITEEPVWITASKGLTFNAIKILRSESLTAQGNGWTSTIDVSDTQWLSKGYGVVQREYSQRDRSSDGGDQTTTVRLIAGGGSLLHSVIGLAVSHDATFVENRDRTPSFQKGTNFDAVDVNGQTQTNTFTITNHSSIPMDVRRAYLGGHDKAEYRIVSSPVGRIMPGESSALTVRFNPSATGLKNARVVIESSDPTANPYSFKISGLGVLVGRISVQEASKTTAITPGDTTARFRTGTNYGDVTIGTSLLRSFVITNTGPGDLVVHSITITSLPVAARAVIPAPFQTPIMAGVLTLAPGESWSYGLYFHPFSEGVARARISMLSNDWQIPVFEFAVQGRGVP